MHESGTTTQQAELAAPWEICQCRRCRRQRINQQPFVFLGRALLGACEDEKQRLALAELEGGRS